LPPVQPERQLIIAKTPGGRLIRLWESTRPVQHEQDEIAVATAAAARPNDFNGTSRKIAKTSFVEGPSREFASVSALRRLLDHPTGNEPDRTEEHMLSLHIPFGRGSEDSARVDKEMQNVTVTGVLYAFKKEPDHDYHVIIGDPPGTPRRKFLNVEVSALPISGRQRATLKAVRDAFKAHFELGDGGTRGYVEPEELEWVRVTGSLFFDMDHAPPHEYVGDETFLPGTAWEIHPLTSIEFLSGD